MLSLACLYFKKDKNTVPFAIAVFVLFAIGEVLKGIFMEPRPCAQGNLSWVSQVACEAGYSFPSDHATVLTGLFVFLKNFKYVRAAYIVWLVIILFSRIYLGQHYLTDVIAGAIISVAACSVIYKYEDGINNFVERALGSILKRKTSA